VVELGASKVLATYEGHSLKFVKFIALSGRGCLSRSARRCCYGQEVTRVAGWGSEVQDCVAADIFMVFGVPSPINARLCLDLH